MPYLTKYLGILLMFVQLLYKTTQLLKLNKKMLHFVKICLSTTIKQIFKSTEGGNYELIELFRTNTNWDTDVLKHCRRFRGLS